MALQLVSSISSIMTDQNVFLPVWDREPNFKVKVTGSGATDGSATSLLDLKHHDRSECVPARLGPGTKLQGLWAEQTQRRSQEVREQIHSSIKSIPRSPKASPFIWTQQK